MLWDTAPETAGAFGPSHIAHLPELARRYLAHTIAPGTKTAAAVRLQMHGEIKLGRWLSFRAKQVIRRDGWMGWSATVTAFGIPIFRGFDRLVGGHGEMRWKLLGMLPIVAAVGPDITRSAAGRVQAESLWLPSMLCGDDVTWIATDPRHATATVQVGQDASPVEFTIDSTGRVEAVKVRRWGNPAGGPFGLVDFGGLVQGDCTVNGYTIPTHARVGWYFGTPRFESDGEFFRATVDDATFR
jgi:hypothetical protein